MCCSDVSKCFPFKIKRAMKNGATGMTLEIKYRATFLRPVSSSVIFRGIIIFLNFIYLFLSELGLHCCSQTFGSLRLLSSCVEPASLGCGLSQSTGSRRPGSAAMLHWLSCAEACAIFPDQESKPVSSALADRLLPLAHQGK